MSTPTLRSEALKVRELRSTWVGTSLILLVSAGMAALISAVADVGTVDERQVIFYSSGLATWAYVFLAAGLVATEFHGTGQATFVATARRGRVLAAKLLLITAGGLGVGLLAATATVGAAQTVLILRGPEPLDLADPGLVRGLVLFLPTSMIVQGLLAACLAVLVRSGVVAVVLAGLLSLAPVSVAPFFGDWYAAHVPRWVPGAAVESLAGIAAPGSYGYLAWPPAAACLLAWIGVLLLIAAVRLPRMDIA
ncbi:hypothetical protein OHA21_12310 [Actinoplanes sp. NBC_00393]|uniref:hypothetical protein n=1 Tax=Actinoplanes sp. NBC_00393 TaxID=2975953 RepID=UPI002E23CD1E